MVVVEGWGEEMQVRVGDLGLERGCFEENGMVVVGSLV